MDTASPPPIRVTLKPVTSCTFCKIPMYKAGDLRIHRQTAEHIGVCKAKGLWCDGCRIGVSTPAKLQAHYSKCHDPNRATAFRCVDCDISFMTEKKLNKHLSKHSAAVAAVIKKPQAVVYPPKVLEGKGTRQVCPTCGKAFISLTHKKFKTHKAECLKAKLKPVTCPGSGKCTKRFKTPSGMINHLESGACKSGLDRHKIHQIVQQHDTNRAITIPNVTSLPLQPSTPLLLQEAEAALTSLTLQDQDESASRFSEIIEIFGDSEDEDAFGEAIVYTPSSSSSDVTGAATPTYTGTFNAATPRDTVTQAISTHIVPTISEKQCPTCFRLFKNKKAAKAHMESPAHGPLLYHCPLRFMGVGSERDEKSFRTLGGMVTHLEIGACKGGNETYQKAILLVEQMAIASGFNLSLKGVNLLTNG